MKAEILVYAYVRNWKSRHNSLKHASSLEDNGKYQISFFSFKGHYGYECQIMRNKDISYLYRRFIYINIEITIAYVLFYFCSRRSRDDHFCISCFYILHVFTITAWLSECFLYWKLVFTNSNIFSHYDHRHYYLVWKQIFWNIAYLTFVFPPYYK